MAVEYSLAGQGRAGQLCVEYLSMVGSSNPVIVNINIKREPGSPGAWKREMQWILGAGNK